MLWIATLSAALIAAGPQVQVETLSGQVLSGELTELTAEQLQLETSDGAQRFEPAELLQCSFTEHEVTAGQTLPAVWVELTDGTLLPADLYETEQGEARIQRGAHEISLPTSAVDLVRFGARSPERVEQWNNLLAARPAGDLVIVRKSNALDFLAGIIRRVTAETVEFEVDGDLLPVKKAKLDGIVYHHAAADQLPTSIARIATRDGGSLSASHVAINENALDITTPAGASMSWPLDELERIDFSQGKVFYLSDLEWDARRSTWEPYFGRAEQVGPLTEFYRPRRNANFSGEPLRLDGQTFRRGLALRSRTELFFRLPEDFRRFVAVAGIDDSVGDAGHVQLRILGDGRTLFDAALSGSDPPVPLQLDIAGVRELQIVVDFGDDLDVADHVSLGEAKVIK